jgi:lysophospholipase L1-like esterase
MLTSDGGLRPELLQKDGLHLNRKGYALWVSIVKPVLEKYDSR